jgi:hypothetical protein
VLAALFVLVPCGDLFEGSLVADDSDGMGIHFDPVHHRPDIVATLHVITEYRGIQFQLPGMRAGVGIQQQFIGVEATSVFNDRQRNANQPPPSKPVSEPLMMKDDV